MPNFGKLDLEHNPVIVHYAGRVVVYLVSASGVATYLPQHAVSAKVVTAVATGLLVLVDALVSMLVRHLVTSPATAKAQQADVVSVQAAASSQMPLQALRASRAQAQQDFAAQESAPPVDPASLNAYGFDELLAGQSSAESQPVAPEPVAPEPVVIRTTPVGAVLRP